MSRRRACGEPKDLTRTEAEIARSSIRDLLGEIRVDRDGIGRADLRLKSGSGGTLWSLFANAAPPCPPRLRIPVGYVRFYFFECLSKNS